MRAPQNSPLGGIQALPLNRSRRASSLLMPISRRWTGRTGRGGEVGEAGEGAPAASGAALLDFDGADSPLSHQPVRLCQPRCQLSSRKARQLLRGNHISHTRQWSPFSQPVNDPLWRVASHPGMRAAISICPLAVGGWRPGPSRGGGTYTFHSGPPYRRS
jgi:hypothetical protein